MQILRMARFHLSVCVRFGANQLFNAQLYLRKLVPDLLRTLTP